MEVRPDLVEGYRMKRGLLLILALIAVGFVDVEAQANSAMQTAVTYGAYLSKCGDSEISVSEIPFSTLGGTLYRGKNLDLSCLKEELLDRKTQQGRGDDWLYTSPDIVLDQVRNNIYVYEATSIGPGMYCAERCFSKSDFIIMATNGDDYRYFTSSFEADYMTVEIIDPAEISSPNMASLTAGTATYVRTVLLNLEDDSMLPLQGNGGHEFYSDSYVFRAHKEYLPGIGGAGTGGAFSYSGRISYETGELVELINTGERCLPAGDFPDNVKRHMERLNMETFCVG